MSELVVIGGLNESKRSLEPVAQEAFAQGFGHDAEILTLHAAMKMDEERLRARLAGANVLTHSAGIMAVPEAGSAGSESELPRSLLVVAGPERKAAEFLRQAGMDKTFAHIFGANGHRRADHLRVAAGNATEIARHPMESWRMVAEVSGFSTVRHMDEGRVTAAVHLGNFLMSDDEFFRPEPGWQNDLRIADMRAAGTVVEELFGGHDELLVAPAGVLAGIRQALGVPALDESLRPA